MSDAPIVEAFPRRPLQLGDRARRRKRRLLALGGVLLLFLPGLWFAWDVIEDQRLRADLRERGVRAQVLESEGRCTSRRQVTGDEPLGCNLTIRYEVRPEHGGGVRSADVWLDGSAPRVFAPPALYDPGDPDRAMLEPEVERDPGWDNLLGPFIPLVIAVLALLLWLAGGDRALARAGRGQRPMVVPIVRAAPGAGNRLQVWFRVPGRQGEAFDLFDGDNGPLLVRPLPGEPDDRDFALALAPDKGRPFLLDRKLTRYDFTDEERAAIWRAAAA